MQDLTKSIIDLLDNESNWDLTENLHRDEITFRRGEPFDLATRFSKNQISIEVCKLINPVLKRTLNTSKNREIVPINLWMMIAPRHTDKLDGLLDNRQTVIDKIRSIIKANQRAVTDVRLAFIETERHIDNYDGEPPALHSVINVHCTYLT